MTHAEGWGECVVQRCSGAQACLLIGVGVWIVGWSRMEQGGRGQRRARAESHGGAAERTHWAWGGQAWLAVYVGRVLNE